MIADRLWDLGANILADVITLFVILPILFYLIAVYLRRLRRHQLIQFFMLDQELPKLTVYLSRHQASIDLPSIHSTDQQIKDSPALKRIHENQIREQRLSLSERQISPRSFAAVSAIEMIEFFRLKEEIENPELLDWFPKEVKDQLFQNKSNVSKIAVDLLVCPSDYKDLKLSGTTVFVGGPRANLGTYYYLYGEEAGKVRPRRLNSEKDIVEYIHGGKDPISGTGRENLAVIQRYKLANGYVVFYLAGTGINGTAAAMAYIRKNWKNLLKSHPIEDFSIVISVERRRDDDLSAYMSTDWNEMDWRKPRE